jgi:murein L,D-transpeptidase YcbB/YkuD
VLSNLIGSSNPGETLALYQPQQAGYRLLKAKLGTMREMTASIGQPLPASRKPLRTTTAMVAQDPVTPLDLIANMERWRWVERELGDRYIEVNLPEFMLHVVDHGKIVHTTRAIVGKPETPTPLFSDKMQYLIVNPSWHVPYSIVKKEFLPKLAEDPDYAAKSGYEVTQNGDLVTIRQPPGERNALGFVKFMFPNQHAVYLHDTPTRKLFANTERAYSHGCVRVDDPFSLAAIVLNDPKYTVDGLKAQIGKGEHLIRLAAPLPVQLTYFTVVPDENGELRKVGDIYGYDQSVQAALGLGQPRTYAALR